MAFSAPQALWLLGLLPIVVALHFMRARRRPRRVTALFLWRRAHADVARRKRFSPSWLLALQLAFVSAAALALSRPQLVAGKEEALALVIDASASMAARSGSGTRLDLAVAEAGSLVTTAERVALIRAGSTATLLAPLLASPSERLAALPTLVAGDAEADLLGAVDLAGQLLPGARVVVFTDQPAQLGRAEVQVVGAEAANVGISAFDVGVGQAFVAVVASGRQPVEVTVGVFDSVAELGRTSLLVPAGGSGSVTFPLFDDPSGPLGVLEARILSPTPDALALDDVAYAGRRTLSVVTDDLYAPLLRALQALPGVLVYGAIDATRRPADLRVVTRSLPTEGPGGVDDLPPGDYVLFPPPAEEPRYHVVRDVDRAAPLMRFVDLGDALVGLDPAAQPWAPVPEAGWRVLARADDLTPLIRARRTEAGAVLQFAFHPSQSDVVLRPAFPALLANWVAELAATPRLTLGQALPGGGGPVLEPGVYRLADGARLDLGAVGRSGRPGPSEPSVLVSLLSSSESRLGSAPLGLEPAAGDPPSGRAVQAPGEAREARAEEGAAAPSRVGLALMAAALAALLAEWWLFAGPRGRRLVGWRA